jgi:hypothetical protein
LFPLNACIFASTLSNLNHAIEYEHILKKPISYRMIRMIAACGRNRVMGSSGTLPWKIQKDWEYFLDTTRDGALVMGRKCYEDFVEHAQERKVVALTRNPNLTFAHAQRAGSLKKVSSWHRLCPVMYGYVGAKKFMRMPCPCAKNYTSLKSTLILRGIPTFQIGGTISPTNKADGKPLATATH